MNEYYLIIGALRCVAKKLDEGASPKEALELAALEMADAGAKVEGSPPPAHFSWNLFKPVEDKRVVIFRKQYIKGNFIAERLKIK